MAGRPKPTVYLRQCNPWDALLPDDTVLRLLDEAAAKGEERIQKWIADGKFEDEASFAQVLLDPTRPRHQRTAQDRVLAVILYGEQQRAKELLPGAIAVADLTDRHRLSTSEIPIICLGTGDFTGGEAVYYEGATSGGNGLASEKRYNLLFTVLRHFVKSVNAERDRIHVMRGAEDAEVWLNGKNRHGGQYDLDIEGDGWLTLAA